MQKQDPISDVSVNLAVALRQDGNRLWLCRSHREAEMQLAVHHVHDRSSNEEELITDGLLSVESSTNDAFTEQQEDEIKEAPEFTEADVAIGDTGDTNLYSEGNEEERVRTMKTVSKEEAMMLRDETTKMWQFRTLVTMENCYHEHLTLIHSNIENHNVSEDEQSPSTKYSYEDSCYKQDDVVANDSEESFHSIEEFIPTEPNDLVDVTDSGSDYYDDAERTLCESIGIQTTATEVCDAASQTVDMLGHSVCVQTEGLHLSDASTNTITMTTNDISTNTIITTTDNAATNTVTMVTVNSATNTVAMELVDVATNTLPKTTTDAIIQTENESLIDKYKKYIEALKTEVTQEKSQRLVAEQMVTIVQSEVENLRQRNIDLTSQQIQLENELSETKVCVGDLE